MLTLLLAILSMAAKDALGTLLVIAEARGRAVLAGALDAASDLAVILTTVFGAGEVIVHGWSTQSITILLAMMVTSFIGTMFWTRVGQRITREPTREGASSIGS